MAQPTRNDVHSNNDWTLAAVGLFVIVAITAIFFRQSTIELTTTVLYFMWGIADIPRVHADAV